MRTPTRACSLGRQLTRPGPRFLSKGRVSAGAPVRKLHLLCVTCRACVLPGACRAGG
jgi:hypothetical protein